MKVRIKRNLDFITRAELIYLFSEVENWPIW
jgi:hypothetical protein